MTRHNLCTHTNSPYKDLPFTVNPVSNDWVQLASRTKSFFRTCWGTTGHTQKDDC